MMRYRHEVTGVVVVVDETTATLLDPAFKPVDDKPARQSPSGGKSSMRKKPKK